MMKDAFENRFEAVLIGQFGQVATDLRDLLWTIGGLADCGIDFVSLKEGFDTTIPSTKAGCVPPTSVACT